MDKKTTIFDDLCLALGMIVDNCKTLGLISEEDYSVVHTVKTKSLYIQHLYSEESPDNETQDKSADRREKKVTAYLSSPLINLLNPEIAKHKNELATWDHNSTQLVPWWRLSYDKRTGKVVEDEVYALCVKAAPMLKELARLVFNKNTSKH